MKDILEELKKEKEKCQKITAPIEFEDRIRQSLNKKSNRKPKRVIMVAAFATILLFGAYNSPTLAYYGKQILGFNQVMNHDLQSLNKAGKGQVINKTITLSNGIQVTLNGIMSDQNQLIAFLTVKSDHLDVTQYTLESSGIQGFLSHSRLKGGMGAISKDKRTTKWEYEFTPPSVFARNLEMNVALLGPNNYNDSGEISFHFDRSKAMPITVEKSIHQTISLGISKLTFKELKASPTQSVVKGEIVVPKTLSKYKEDHGLFEFELLANGKPLREQGGGMASRLPNRASFTNDFSPLPQPLKSLSLKIIKAPVHGSLIKSLSLSELKPNSVINLENNPITVISHKVKEGKTTLVLKMDETVYLNKLFVQNGTEQVLGTPSDVKFTKEADGIKKQIAYTFNTQTKPNTLVFENYDFVKTFNKVIPLSVK